MFKKFLTCAAVVLLTTTLTGCAMFRFGGGAGELPPSVEALGPDHEEKLRALVDDSLAKQNRFNTADKARESFRKPYHFKEFVEYPDGIDSYTIEFRSSESLITPYSAQVRLAKNRYVTEFQRKQNVARRDTVFYESTGHETLSYELRSGRWRETGKLFVAEETDQRLKDAASRVRFFDSSSVDADGKSGLGKLMFWRD